MFIIPAPRRWLRARHRLTAPERVRAAPAWIEADPERGLVGWGSPDSSPHLAAATGTESAPGTDITGCFGCAGLFLALVLGIEQQREARLRQRRGLSADGTGEHHPLCLI